MGILEDSGVPSEVYATMYIVWPIGTNSFNMATGILILI